MGNTERNQFYGPGGFNLDASIFRGFPIGGTKRLEFRLEAANLTNSPIFNPPNGDVTSGDFMRITALQSGYDTRQVRLGLRFQFSARSRLTEGPGSVAAGPFVCTRARDYADWLGLGGKRFIRRFRRFHRFFPNRDSQAAASRSDR